MNNMRKKLSPWFWAFLVWGLLVVMTSVLLALWSLYQSPVAIVQALDEIAPGLLAWRLILFGVLIVHWAVWVDRIVRGYSLGSAQRIQLIEARWTVALWLIALELVLGQNLFGQWASFAAGYMS